MTDDPLTRAQKGDHGAFEQILLSYEKMIYSIAYRYMENAEDAKDITQEAVIKIYHSLASCKAWESFKAWAARITVNTALDELRRRKNKQAVNLEDTCIAAPDGAPDEIAASRETLRDILSAIHKLPDDYRTLIILRDLQGFTYDELSRALSLPMGTVKSKLSRARISLQKILEPSQNS
ncbi:MAG: sigma-70 family RNA polymerase sigma factor [Clostridiales bacterium]|jgi:RNA polymerase sigma-70 factor (ECF subfamily)|nr:sigma-70 family RNA polymerase sigma factor [Clostridiales bacterium]